jgi:hypothetical protein
MRDGGRIASRYIDWLRAVRSGDRLSRRDKIGEARLDVMYEGPERYQWMSATQEEDNDRDRGEHDEGKRQDMASF